MLGTTVQRLLKLDVELATEEHLSRRGVRAGPGLGTPYSGHRGDPEKAAHGKRNPGSVGPRDLRVAQGEEDWSPGRNILRYWDREQNKVAPK